MNPAILALLNAVLPTAIATVKEKFAKENPDSPPLTDEQVHAAMLNWLAGTLAKDDRFLEGS